MKDFRMLRVFSQAFFVLLALALLLSGCGKPDEESRKDARKYFEQAVDYYNREYFTNAKELFEDVLEIENDLNLKENFGEANLYLGLISFREEDFESALKFNQRAKDFFKLKLKRREEGIAENNIGNVYSAAGEFSKAEEHYRKALLISQLAADKEGEADALMNIAQVFFELGDFRNAFQNYSKAFDAYDLIGIQTGKANAAIRMGESQLRFGAYNEALRSFDFALNLVASNGIKKYEPDILNFVALTYFQMGEFDQAMQILEQAEQLILISETQTELNWVIKNNLADVYAKTFQYVKAIEKYKSAINILSEYGEGLLSALLKLKLGLTYLNTAENGDNTNVEKAFNLFEDLSEYFEDINYPQGRMNALAGLAKCYFLKGDIDKSVSTCEEIKELITRHPIIIKNKLTGQLCSSPDIFRDMRIAEIFLSDNKIEEAITFDLMVKENFASYFIASIQRSDRNLSNKLISAEIDFLSFEIVNEESKEAGSKNSTKLSYLKEKLEEKMNHAGQQKKSTDKSNSTSSITEIKKRLKSNQAVAAYFPLQEKINVVVITKQKNQNILLPISKEALSGQVKNLINFFNKNDFASAREILKGMNTSLFKPIEYLVKDYSSLVFYTPEDIQSLNFLPFHALIDKSEKLLAEKYSIEYFGGFKNKNEFVITRKNIFISLNNFPIKPKESEKLFEFWSQKDDLKNKINKSNPKNLILMSPVHIRLNEPSSSYFSLSSDSIRSKEFDASVSELSQISCENLFLLNYFDDYAGSSCILGGVFSNATAFYINRLFNAYNQKEKLALNILSQLNRNEDFSIHDFYKQNFSSPALNWAGLFSYIKL